MWQILLIAIIIIIVIFISYATVKLPLLSSIVLGLIFGLLLTFVLKPQIGTFEIPTVGDVSYRVIEGILIAIIVASAFWMSINYPKRGAVIIPPENIKVREQEMKSAVS